MTGPVPLVRVVRSGVLESVHAGHVAVCDPRGRLLSALGDPHRVVYSRSSTKPLQAAVSLRHIGEDLPDDLLAIMAASHNAEPLHVQAVRRLLRRARVPASALRCPPDLPSLPRDARRAGRATRIAHNCSGKHAGMLFACVRAGWDLETYLAKRHPLQRDVLRAVRAGTGVDRPLVGVDGCGAPVHGAPLSAMATLFARLVRPERLGPYGAATERVVSAMRARPFVVAGTGRTDTSLMTQAPDVVSKVGAEGLYCAASLERGIGVAVRIEDGGDRASGPALIHALAELDVLGPEDVERLAPVARRPVLGGGRPVGAVEATFRLPRARG